MSTPSETMRTATSQRSSDAANCLIFFDAVGVVGEHHGGARAR